MHKDLYTQMFGGEEVGEQVCERIDHYSSPTLRGKATLDVNTGDRVYHYQFLWYGSSLPLS